ncbi:phospholipase D [Dictyostelium discoideum AX4]|uniref:Phospholipase D n=1 Tax=Dictyostelium discoideum TaxID=44689 RepID=Q54P99_DICDI|nr:phospholipase D [Dictyostelium discoideum AX4]EAL65113.2 phospholipase D [Dictyostelium discoideum AX4]|eukprot:XP_638476.2 phospholipase D [Dictyostelium discoideum AX4]
MNSFLARVGSLGNIFKSKSFSQQFRKNLKNESYYKKVKSSWMNATQKLFKLDEPTKGNNVTIFFTGDEMFRHMWGCIKSAKESIYLETYTIEPDLIGNKTIELLTEAQRRGVQVKFAYDSIGSSGLSDFDIYEMRVSGVDIYQFNPVEISSILPYTLRNHRKIIVVDEKYGFCGGMNISGKYASSNMDGGKDYFRDTHCMIEGPAVKNLLNIFHDSVKDKRIIEKPVNKIGSPALLALHFPYASEMDSKIYKKPIYELNEEFKESIENNNQYINNNDNNNYKDKELDDEYEDEDDTFNDITQSTYYHYQPPINSTNYTNNNKIRQNEKNLIKLETQQQFLKDEDLTEFTIEDDDDDEEGEDDDENEDEFKEFVSLTSEYKNLENLNKLNDYLNDESNINLNNGNGSGSKKIEIVQSKTISNAVVQVQQSNQFRNKREIQKALLIALNKSYDHCYFTTPYFLPPRKLRKAIVNAAKRGVDVKIITAGKSDVPWFRNASRYIYPLFLKHEKIKIYELESITLHAKTLSIDGMYSTIGSYNLDTWSQRNLEANLAFFSPNVVKVLEDQFKNDLKSCSEVTLKDIGNRPFLDRLICFFAFQMSKILKPT